ncbi:hypothetical protein MY11210_005619 [Beauveria gryllotalpidicola]
MAIKERHAHDTPAHGRAEQEPQSPSKRPHSAVVADSHPQSASPTPDTLVSSWLDSIYPTAKRLRRNSELTTDETAPVLLEGGERGAEENSKDNQDNTGTRASSEASMARGGDGGFGRPPTPLTNKSARLSQGFSQGYTAPSRPATPSRGASYRTGGTPSTSSLVDAEHYRRENLARHNGIKMHTPDDPLPSALQALVESLGLQQPPPTPTTADEERNKAIRARNTCLSKPLETSIRPLFDDCIFPKPIFGDLLLRTESLIMNKATVATKFSSADLLKLNEEARQNSKLSTPVPDILYGYFVEGLTDEIQDLLSATLGDVSVVNAENMVLPFLVVEFKGDGGSMWSCVNQCLGGSAACVNVGRRLNTKLVAKDQRPSFNSAVFSITINQEHANLYVSWRPESDPAADPAAEYYMQRIGLYATEDMQHHLILQRAVRKIIDWGMGPRLDQIRECLGLAGSKKRKLSERSSADVEEPKTQVEEPKEQVEEPKEQVEEPKAKVEEPKAQVEEPKAQVEEPKAQVEEPKEQVADSVPPAVESVSQVKESMLHDVESVSQVEEHVPLV